MGIFDSKNFNSEVFGKYVEKTPNLKRNELIRSKALKPRQDIAASFSDQSGSNYAVTPIFARIGGDAQNYNGETDLTATSMKTYTQGRIVVGRMNAWQETDFSYDITGGVDFLAQAATQIGEYWDEVDQQTLLSELEGIFSMTGAKNAEFVDRHTYDITGDNTANGKFGATTLNSAMQYALGDNKSMFTLAILHSAVATGLENLHLLDYLKYTDKQGIQRDLAFGTLNGRSVIVDDSMPTRAVKTYKASTDTAVNSSKTYYTRSGSENNYTYTAVASPTGNPSTSNYFEKDREYTEYTSYALGDGAIEYTNCGVKVPYELSRNATKNGGIDMLISRQRKIFAPRGISWTDPSIVSPTNAQLAMGSKWSLANSNESTKEYYPHKAIPIVRITSRG